MTRPATALIDLVAGRQSGSLIDLPIVRSAIEHKVHGLLKNAMDSGIAVTPEAEIALDQADVASWARNRMLRGAAAEIAALAVDMELDVALLKGASIETRWYGRVGERPSWDIDLLIAPWHIHRTTEFLAALQPTHTILPYVSEGLRHGLQSIDLAFQGLPVDLHLDPLKLEIGRTRVAEAFWDDYQWLEIDAANIRVLSPEATLLLAALHLNKDRFRSLLGYSDLIRIGQTEDLDRDRLSRMLRQEGLEVSFAATVESVASDLGLEYQATEAGVARWAWNRAWPQSIRLLGAEGRLRFRHRQFILLLLDRRRWREALLGWLRRLIPPDWILRRTYPEEKGPYALRLVSGRVRSRLARWRARKSIERA